MRAVRALCLAGVVMLAGWTDGARYAPPVTLLKQYQTDQSEIPPGGTVNGTSVVLQAQLGNGSTTGQQKLRVEVKPVAANFTGEITAESDVKNDGETVQVTVSGLVAGDYKWRAWGWCT